MGECGRTTCDRPGRGTAVRSWEWCEGWAHADAPEFGEPGNFPGVRGSVKRPAPPATRERGGTAPFAPNAVSHRSESTCLTCARSTGYDGRALSCVGPALAHGGGVHGPRGRGGQPTPLAQGSNDRLVRACGRVAVGTGGAGARHRADAAGRSGSWLVREVDRDRQRADDDRVAGARGRAG